MKDLFTEDLIETIKRLNNELTERVNFEAKLLDVIEENQKTIKELKEKLELKNSNDLKVQDIMMDLKLAGPKNSLIGKDCSAIIS